MRRSPAAGAGIPTTFEGASCPILQEPWKNAPSSVFPFIDPFLPGSIRPDSSDDRSGPPRPPSGAREPLVETHELFFRTECDLDPSSAPAAHDPHARAQPTGELLLGVAGER